MEHRHLNHQAFSATAIDDIIERGNRVDWAELRDMAASSAEIRRMIVQVCEARAQDLSAQRHYLWRHYASNLPA